ncbi:MAG: M12 family metallopeptidase [Sphingomonas sp.]
MPNNAPKHAPVACTPKALPHERRLEAAKAAQQENPRNMPALHALAQLVPGFAPTADHIAIVTQKYWRTNGVVLPVGFMDNPPNELRARILSHMNAWGKTANVLFSESDAEPKVRISRGSGGYWSYLGTDILLIDPTQQTMNLEGFTMDTPDSEFYRVVRHETGHTLGCPHEHMRADLVALIDPDKAIAYFGATQGWTPDEVRQQVLTPLDPSTLTATGPADEKSIMCYQIPGELTHNGQPIIGGSDIDASDYAFMGKIYPKPPTSSFAPAAPHQGAVDSDDHHQHDDAASHLATHHHDHRSHAGCIEIDLPRGHRLLVHPDVSEQQLRRALAAVDG